MRFPGGRAACVGLGGVLRNVEERGGTYRRLVWPYNTTRFIEHDRRTWENTSDLSFLYLYAFLLPTSTVLPHLPTPLHRPSYWSLCHSSY